MAEKLDEALAWLDRTIADCDLQRDTLRAVRDELRRIVGDDREDGWAQRGHRGDE